MGGPIDNTANPYNFGATGADWGAQQDDNQFYQNNDCPERIAYNYHQAMNPYGKPDPRDVQATTQQLMKENKIVYAKDMTPALAKAGWKKDTEIPTSDLTKMVQSCRDKAVQGGFQQAAATSNQGTGVAGVDKNAGQVNKDGNPIVKGPDGKPVVIGKDGKPIAGASTDPVALVAPTSEEGKKLINADRGGMADKFIQNLLDPGNAPKDGPGFDNAYKTLVSLRTGPDGKVNYTDVAMDIDKLTNKNPEGAQELAKRAFDWKGPDGKLPDDQVKKNNAELAVILSTGDKGVPDPEKLAKLGPDVLAKVKAGLDGVTMDKGKPTNLPESWKEVLNDDKLGKLKTAVDTAQKAAPATPPPAANDPKAMDKQYNDIVNKHKGGDGNVNWTDVGSEIADNKDPAVVKELTARAFGNENGPDGKKYDANAVGAHDRELAISLGKKFTGGDGKVDVAKLKALGPDTLAKMDKALEGTTTGKDGNLPDSLKDVPKADIDKYRAAITEANKK